MAERALRIGATDDGMSRFTLPAALGTQTVAVVGIRGSGKTNTATVEVEQLLGLHHQVVVIDPTDVWWGLKSSSDGSAPGFPVVILGGPHGDLPLEPEMGPALADFAVESRAPLVLSLRHLRKGRQQHFVTDFCEQLYHRKGELEHRTPLLVVIDEASAFVPQRVGGAEARMVGAIEDLVRRGRAAGIGVTLIDQRPASINKNVLTQLEVLVAHRITSPQDRRALDEWIRQHDTAGDRDTFLDQLPSLPQGHAWVWSPALDVFARVSVNQRETFDSSRTPKPGEDARAPAAWAEVDLDALRSQLAESLQEAEASDPKRLQARIQELEAELRRAQRTAEPDPEAIERAVDAVRAPLLQRIMALETRLHGAAEIVDQLGALLRNGPAPASPPPTPAPSTTLEPASRRAPHPAERRATAAGSTTPAPAQGVSGPQQKILDALATYRAFGQEAPERTAVAMLAGYKPNSGHVNNVIGSLSTAGLIDYPGPGLITLRAEGVRLAQAKPIRTLQDLHAAWMAVLDGPQRRLLEVLLEHYPDSLRSEQAAEAAGYAPNSGHFNNVRGSLRTLGAIDYPQPGWVRASDLLFPEGLR